MTDEKTVKIEDEPVVLDEPELEDEAVADEAETGDLVISIEGAEPEEEDPEIAAIEDPEQKSLAARIRDGERQRARKQADKLKAERDAAIAERDALKPKAEAPKKPTLEDAGYNEERFLELSRSWVKAETDREAEAAAEKKRVEDLQNDYAGRAAKYHENKKTLGAADYDDAESAFTEQFDQNQQSILIRVSDIPERVVYALSKSPKLAAELAAIKDSDRFAYRIAKLEGQIKVERKSPPAPETKLQGGSGVTPLRSSAKLDALYKRAQETGDRSEYDAERRRLRDLKTG